MKGSRFSEEQIIAVLREQEAGARTEEACRAARDLERNALQSGSRSTVGWGISRREAAQGAGG